jgi:hypothetical protein
VINQIFPNLIIPGSLIIDHCLPRSSLNDSEEFAVQIKYKNNSETVGI